MLTLLKISNLALVESLKWNVGSGLVCVTGETGAGKSVIVGGLKMVLGERADKGMIRTGETQCVVEAVFDIDQDGAGKVIDRILEQSGIDGAGEGQLIIKRVVGQSSNRQFVNNCPATLAVLKSLGAYLVDLHGPHDHQSLNSPERQLSMLDAYSGASKERNVYQQLWREWKDKFVELEALRKADQASMQELDLLRYQVEEIDAAQINPAEEEEIEERYRRVSNSSKLVETCGQIVSILTSGVVQQLGEVQRLARELERLDSGTASLLGGLDSAVLEVQELERSLMDYTQELEMDPAEALRLEERINTFEQLKRKYGPSLEDVLVHADDARERLRKIENRDEVLVDLQAEVDTLLIKVEDAGAKLSAKRKKKAPKLAKDIASHLADLGFKQAAFDLTLEACKTPSLTGLESVDFQFGPNPGEPLKPLRQIASSGEVSRVMLAVKSALVKQDVTPLMVFDEIDANVGGEIARAVGEKMAGLGESHQVISITHFPQVAAVAQQHFVVAKHVEDGRTSSSLTEVEHDERISELVRMLGGGDGEQARAMAKSLIR